MKVKRIAILIALAVTASAAHAIVVKPQPIIDKSEKEIVEFCKLFPDASICNLGTDGAGNGGGKRPPQ